jgi:hypothetical protein
MACHTTGCRVQGTVCIYNDTKPTGRRMSSCSRKITGRTVSDDHQAGSHLPRDSSPTGNTQPTWCRMLSDNLTVAACYQTYAIHHLAARCRLRRARNYLRKQRRHSVGEIQPALHVSLMAVMSRHQRNDVYQDTCVLRQFSVFTRFSNWQLMGVW